MAKIYYKDDNVVLILGDCTEALPKLKIKFDCIVTDPPYKVTPKGCAGTMGGYWKGASANRGNIFTHNDTKCGNYLPLLNEALKDGTHCYIMINHINLIEMLNTAVSSGFSFIKSLIWDKGNKICSRFYMNCFEYILMFRHGSSRDINNFSTPDILRVPIKKLKGTDGKNLHDTEKPVDLMKILIENSTRERQTVLDPFCGIGATLIAALESNRKAVGIEMDEKYCEIAKQRVLQWYEGHN